MKPIPGYKTAEELGITETEHEGLSNVVEDLLSLDPSKFAMNCWGTCILSRMTKTSARYDARLQLWSRYSDSLAPLFVPWNGSETACWKHCSFPWSATPQEAATAVVHFLTHGA